MWIKILTENYRDKNNNKNRYYTGKEYTTDNGYSFVKAEDIGKAMDYFDQKDIRKVHFMEIEALSEVWKEGTWCTYKCKKIKFIGELSLEKVINLDTTGQIKNRLKMFGNLQRSESRLEYIIKCIKRILRL